MRMVGDDGAQSPLEFLVMVCKVVLPAQIWGMFLTVATSHTLTHKTPQLCLGVYHKHVDESESGRIVWRGARKRGADSA